MGELGVSTYSSQPAVEQGLRLPEVIDENEKEGPPDINGEITAMIDFWHDFYQYCHRHTWQEVLTYADQSQRSFNNFNVREGDKFSPDQKTQLDRVSEVFGTLPKFVDLGSTVIMGLYFDSEQGIIPQEACPYHRLDAEAIQSNTDHTKGEVFQTLADRKSCYEQLAHWQGQAIEMFLDASRQADSKMSEKLVSALFEDMNEIDDRAMGPLGSSETKRLLSGILGPLKIAILAQKAGFKVETAPDVDDVSSGVDLFLINKETEKKYCVQVKTKTFQSSLPNQSNQKASFQLIDDAEQLSSPPEKATFARLNQYCQSNRDTNFPLWCEVYLNVQSSEHDDFGKNYETALISDFSEALSGNFPVSDIDMAESLYKLLSSNNQGRLANV